MNADEPDRELLSAYARERSEDAFARIVKRHSGLVHGVAVRVLRDEALARDVGQEVFIRLAKFAPGIDGVALPAWLHKTTYRAAVDMSRTEVRRRSREARSVSDVETRHSNPDHWDEAKPFLDAALLHLKVSDRQALLARFYEDKTFREIGIAFGKTESGARMQVTRALEKVSSYLTHRGVCIPAVALATGLSAEFSRAAQIQALAAYSAVASNAVTASHSGTLLSALTTMTNTAKIALTTTLLVAATGSCYFWLFHPGELGEGPAIDTPTTAENERKLSKAEIAVSTLRKLKHKANAISYLKGYDSAVAAFDALDTEVQDAISKLDSDDISDAISVAVNSDGAMRERQFAVMRLFERWAAIAPERAFAVANERAEKLPSEWGWGGQWGFGRKDAAIGWGKTDPVRAIAAVDELFVDSEIEGLRDIYLGYVIQGWVRSDPVAAIAGVEALPSYDQQVAANGFAQTLRSSLRTRVSTALSSVSDEWLRANLCKEIGGFWARFDGLSAAAWFDTIKWETPQMATIPAGRIVQSWIGGTDDIGPALDWFDRFYAMATEEMKSGLTRLVTRKWETSKLPAAAEWLQNQRALDDLQSLGKFQLR